LKLVTSVKLMIIATFILATPAVSRAAPTTKQQAGAVVQGWLKANPTPLNEPLGQKIGEVHAFQDEDGQLAYYVVYLDPAGFVIVPADDLVEPILGFARAGRYDSSGSNPLGALVSRDVHGRMAQARDLGAAALYGSFLAAQSKWDWLKRLEKDQPGSQLRLDSISDIRVPPLVQSLWNQQTDDGGMLACYNFYTPPGLPNDPANYPCGCVATAMAQLMRYYCFPVGSVDTQTLYSIRIEYTNAWRQLLGGSGPGGAYV